MDKDKDKERDNKNKNHSPRFSAAIEEQSGASTPRSVRLSESMHGSREACAREKHDPDAYDDDDGQDCTTAQRVPESARVRPHSDMKLASRLHGAEHEGKMELHISEVSKTRTRSDKPRKQATSQEQNGCRPATTGTMPAHRPTRTAAVHDNSNGNDTQTSAGSSSSGTGKCENPVRPWSCIQPRTSKRDMSPYQQPLVTWSKTQNAPKRTQSHGADTHRSAVVLDSGGARAHHGDWRFEFRHQTAMASGKAREKRGKNCEAWRSEVVQQLPGDAVRILERVWSATRCSCVCARLCMHVCVHMFMYVFRALDMSSPSTHVSARVDNLYHVIMVASP
jgi:hypothetical protein